MVEVSEELERLEAYTYLTVPERATIGIELTVLTATELPRASRSPQFCGARPGMNFPATSRTTPETRHSRPVIAWANRGWSGWTAAMLGIGTENIEVRVGHVGLEADDLRHANGLQELHHVLP